MRRKAHTSRVHGGDAGLWHTDWVQKVLWAGVATGVIILGASRAQVEAQDIPRQGRSESHAYAYVAEGRRDPFQSIVQPSRVPQVQEVAVQPSSLPNVHWTLLGIMTGKTGHYAMLQHGNGGRYLVSLGDILPGEPFRVAAMTPAGVTLELVGPNGHGFSKENSRSQIIELTFKAVRKGV